MQDTVLVRLFYHQNTAHTNAVVSQAGTKLVHHLQMLARRRRQHTKRLTHLENQNVQGANAVVHADTRRPAGMSKTTEPFDLEVSIIVSNLPEENDEDLKMNINALIQEGIQI